MQAIILAAGMGRRLGDLTRNNTKCMIEVNGVKLIDRMLSQLFSAGLSRIVIVVGYEGKALRDYIVSRYPDAPLEFVENPVYDRTNNIYSLWLARDYMTADDTLLLESDLIFEDDVLRRALLSKDENIALVAKYQTWMDGTMVRIDSDCNIVNFVPKKAFRYSDTDDYYKTVNIYKFSRSFVRDQYLPFLEAYIKVLGENEYYEQVLRVITLIDSSDLKAVPVGGLKWYEIDDIHDLSIAETIFASPEERLRKLQHSFGGYWRYPGLLDFCYLVNPYFPRQRMIDEMKANFEALLRDYPSGMGINSLLAGKYFGVGRDKVVVGNGAAELIKALMESVEGRVGVVSPTFEEYPNRLDSSRLEIYHPEPPALRYTVEDLMAWFDDSRHVDVLLLVNPDNPSGNFVSRDDCLRLAQWCADRGTMLVVDESFVDFAEGALADNTLLHDNLLEANPSLCVMKSISKSYGVPGLRLGVLASGNTALIDRMKRDVAIWNINSFAEFYMQIYGKYENDYLEACAKFKHERELFGNELRSVPFLRVFPSQANYFLCEVLPPFTSYSLTLRLLADHDILIKDCGSKKGFPAGRQYVRIAVRDRADNSRLAGLLAGFGRD